MTTHIVDLGNYNGDGKADILWQNNSGRTALLLMNGTSIIGGDFTSASLGAGLTMIT